MNWNRSLSVALCLAAAVSARASSGAFEELRAAGGADAADVAAPAAKAVGAPPAQTMGQSAGAPALPAEFVIHERVISLVTKFDLTAGSASFGTITQQFFSLARAFTYDDASGRCVARARARILSWGSHVDVTDCADRPIGSIKEQVLKSLFKVHTTYSMLDASGAEIATSTKVGWISTEVTITRPDGRKIATLSRPWLSILSDIWTVKLADQAAVDSRMIVMIAAYKTSVDNARRREAASDK